MASPIRRRLAGASRTLAGFRASQRGWDLTDVARTAELRARLAGLLMLAGVGPAVRGP